MGCLLELLLNCCIIAANETKNMNTYTLQTVVIHYDEIALKKNNRAYFEHVLVKNIKKGLKGNNIQAVRRQFGRILVDLGEKSDVEQVVTLLQKIPGINSISPAYIVPKTLDDMKDAVQSFDEILSKAVTFAIDVRRPDREFPIVSMECERQLGGAVLERHAHLKVQLSRPEVTVHFEIAPEAVYMYAQKYQGIGGLPVGTSGKMVCLLSGGIDSPVAAYQMMKRGAQVIFVHFKNFTQDSTAVENKIEQLATILSTYQPRTQLFIVPFADIQKTIIAHVPANFRMIVYRRFMVRIAERIALQKKAKGLITGDSVGQVASQTLENLTSVHAVSSMFIASPLIGMNKRQIMDEAHRIGTYETSILPYDDCCSMFIAKHPATKSTPDEMAAYEEKIDIDSVISEALKQAERRDISIEEV